MKKLGIFITTHFNPEHRNWSGWEKCNVFSFFTRYAMPKYRDLHSGLGDNEWDITLVDTGNAPALDEWFRQEAESFHSLRIVKAPNRGGVFAHLLYCKDVAPEVLDQYDYFLFHVDDTIEPTEDGWATDMIAEYEEANSFCRMGLMGRRLDLIELDSTRGLIRHGGKCPHVAKIWGLEGLSVVPHLHADYYFANRETIQELCMEWDNPYASQESMDYQVRWEASDFASIPAPHKGHVHIGRETDISLRVTKLLNRGLVGYPGCKFNATPVGDRPNRSKYIA